MELGKRLYKSTALRTLKVTAIAMNVVVLLNLYFQTINDQLFLSRADHSLKGVWNFHLFYPEELIIYLIFILFPSIYYGFIRGVSFFENGIVINRGLPFFKYVIPFNEIESFEVIHPKFLMAIKHKNTEDDILFSIRHIDRAVAILDQHGVKGDLGRKLKGDWNSRKKLVLFFIIAGGLMALIQYSGIIREIFR